MKNLKNRKIGEREKKKKKKTKTKDEKMMILARTMKDTRIRYKLWYVRVLKSTAYNKINSDSSSFERKGGGTHGLTD